MGAATAQDSPRGEPARHPAQVSVAVSLCGQACSELLGSF